MCLNDRIISFDTWHARQVALIASTLSSEEGLLSKLPIPFMDLRSADDRAKRRLIFRDKTFQLVPFPIEYLKERSFELPARHVEFAILVSSTNLAQASSFLLGSKDNSRKRAQKPWLVKDVLIDDSELWEQAGKLGLVQVGVDEPIYPLPRLWQPDQMVESVLLPLLRESLLHVQHPIKKQKADTTDDGDTIDSDCEIWDLASGAGRDVAFLAEELKAAKVPFRKVVGIDHRYNSKEQSIVNGFWERRDVGELTSCVKMDLSTFENGMEDLLSNRNVVALLAVRFWKPSLVEAIARNESGSLNKGTFFAISHFCKPFHGAPWNFEHPTEKTVLQRNQLKELFGNKDSNEGGSSWEILHDEIAMDSDHGRTMIHFVARLR